MNVIFVIILILFLFLLRWVWISLGSIDRLTKIKCIVCGLVVLYVLTYIIYNVSKIGITYDNKEAMKAIRTVFVMLFTVINGYIILPYVFRKLDQINNDELEKEKIKRSIIILVIEFVVLVIFEILYFRDLITG